MVKANWENEELIENWTLLPTELELVSKKVGANQIGFAVLLKYFQAFARFPDSSAEVSIAEPNGTIEKVIFPVVSLKTFKDLVAEYKGTGLAYKRRVHNVMRSSFANHYRRMIPQLLELLEFRSNNDLHRPVIEALELLKKYASSKARYYDSTEEIPIDGVLKTGAKEILMETDSDGNERINRINYEICVLTALRERLSCEEELCRQSRSK